MPRIARIVVPGLAYHITHRGNHREDIFYRRQDRWVYKKWLRRYCARHRLEVWAYCLMTNHVQPHRGREATRRSRPRDRENALAFRAVAEPPKRMVWSFVGQSLLFYPPLTSNTCGPLRGT